MSEAICFSALAAEGVLAQRVTADQQLFRERDTLLAELAGSQRQFLCGPTWEPLTAPAEGAWYAVSLRTIRLELGFSNLLTYRVETYPGASFHLGFLGHLEARVAHLSGLRSWLLGRDRVTEDSLANDLGDLLKPAVQQAVTSVLPAEPIYEECLAAREALERAIERAIFPVLYQQGLCMRPGSWQIDSFAKPIVFAPPPHN